MDRSGRRVAALLLLPALVVVAVVAAAPIGLLFRVALYPPGPVAPLSGGPELESFAGLLSAPYPSVALRTLRLSVLTTALVTLLGFPVALFLSRSRGLSRRVQTLLIVSPLLMSVVVRAYGWMLILGRQGFVGETLAALSLPRAGLLHTEAAVLLALTESFLPFMILALAASLDRIDPDLLAAARGPGSFVRTYLLPRSWCPSPSPGFLAGASFVMVGSLSAYAIPALLGGSAARTFVMEIYELVTISFDWPTAAAASLALLPLRLGASRRSGAAQPPPVGARLRDLAARDETPAAQFSRWGLERRCIPA